MRVVANRMVIAMAIMMIMAGLAGALDYDRAAGMMPSAPPYLRSGQQEIGHPVEGEVLRIEGEQYFVEDPYGNEIRFIVNESTLRTGPISQGERVEARVDNEDHALSIRPVRAPDQQSPIPGRSDPRIK